MIGFKEFGLGVGSALAVYMAVSLWNDHSATNQLATAQRDLRIAKHDRDFNKAYGNTETAQADNKEVDEAYKRLQAARANNEQVQVEVAQDRKDVKEYVRADGPQPQAAAVPQLDSALAKLK